MQASHAVGGLGPHLCWRMASSGVPFQARLFIPTLPGAGRPGHRRHERPRTRAVSSLRGPRWGSVCSDLVPDRPAQLTRHLSRWSVLLRQELPSPHGRCCTVTSSCLRGGWGRASYTPGLACVAGLGTGMPPVSSPTGLAPVTAHLSWADRTSLVSVVAACSGVHQPSCWAVLDTGSRLHLNSFLPAPCVDTTFVFRTLRCWTAG